MEKNSGISLTVNEDDFNEIKNMVSLMRQCWKDGAKEETWKYL